MKLIKTRLLGRLRARSSTGSTTIWCICSKKFRISGKLSKVRFKTLRESKKRYLLWSKKWQRFLFSRSRYLKSSKLWLKTRCSSSRWKFRGKLMRLLRAWCRKRMLWSNSWNRRRLREWGSSSKISRGMTLWSKRAFTNRLSNTWNYRLSKVRKRLFDYPKTPRTTGDNSMTKQENPPTK